MKKGPVSTTVNGYIAGFPPDVQVILQKIRQTIQKAAPDAEEKISYQIPTFAFHGNLVHFAAWKDHIGFYPASSGVRQFKKELAGYAHSKGTIQFPLDEPIPYALIAKITKFRVRENSERGATKSKSKKTTARQKTARNR